MLKDQLSKTSGWQFHRWLFVPEKFSGLSRNGPLAVTTNRASGERQFLQSCMMNHLLDPDRNVLPAFEGTLIYFASYLPITAGYNDPLKVNEGVVSKETMVLRRWGSSIQKFGFINGVDNVNWPPYRDSKS